MIHVIIMDSKWIIWLNSLKGVFQRTLKSMFQPKVDKILYYLRIFDWLISAQVQNTLSSLVHVPRYNNGDFGINI